MKLVQYLSLPFHQRLAALAASRISSFIYCRSVAIVILLLLLPLYNTELQVLFLICFSVQLLTMKKNVGGGLGFFEIFLHCAIIFYELVCELVFSREKNVLKQDSSSSSKSNSVRRTQCQ